MSQKPCQLCGMFPYENGQHRPSDCPNAARAADPVAGEGFCGVDPFEHDRKETPRQELRRQLAAAQSKIARLKGSIEWLHCQKEESDALIAQMHGALVITAQRYSDDLMTAVKCALAAHDRLMGKGGEG